MIDIRSDYFSYAVATCFYGMSKIYDFNVFPLWNTNISELNMLKVIDFLRGDKVANKVEYRKIDNTIDGEWLEYDELKLIPYFYQNSSNYEYEFRVCVNLDNLENFLEERLSDLKEGEVEGMMWKYDIQKENFKKRLGSIETDLVGVEPYLEDDDEWHLNAFPLLVYENIKSGKMQVWNAWFSEKDGLKKVRYGIENLKGFNDQKSLHVDRKIRYNSSTNILSFRHRNVEFREKSIERRLIDFLVENKGKASTEYALEKIYGEEFENDNWRKIYNCSRAINGKLDFIRENFGEDFVSCTKYDVWLNYEVEEI